MSDTQTPDSDMPPQAAQAHASGPQGAPLSDGELDAVSGGGVGDAFSGLPMGALIGGPLNAASSAQTKAATATADFLNNVGFKP